MYKSSLILLLATFAAVEAIYISNENDKYETDEEGNVYQTEGEADDKPKPKPKKNEDDDDENVSEHMDSESGSMEILMSQNQVDTNQEDRISKAAEKEVAKDDSNSSKKPEPISITKDMNKDGIDLKNINNQQYVGEILMGTPPQAMTFMFDTGSSIVYAQTSRCKKGCPDRLVKFDPEQSSSFAETPDKRQDQNYGQGFVTGDFAKDQFCFGPSQTDCPEYSFLAVDKGKELTKDQFGGIIGLAPSSGEEQSNIPSFIQQANQVFSFYLSKGSGSKGNLKFGGWDLNRFAKSGSTDQDIIWTSLVDESEGWTIPMSGVKFQNGSSMNIKSEQITLDTGLSYALVPPRDIDDIISKLNHASNISCSKDGYSDLDMFTCGCSESQYKETKPMQINIQNKLFTLPTEAWMSFNEANKGKECKILMHPYDISMTATLKWVVGVQFLQNFYSIFDYSNKKIGLIEVVGS